MNLSEVNIGDTVRIESINSSDLKSKLLELGFIQGKEITVKFCAPFGDPIAVEIDGYTISLRKSEARLIQLKSN